MNDRILMWHEIRDREMAREKLSALERFVFEYEPNDREEAGQFRRALALVCQELRPAPEGWVY